MVYRLGKRIKPWRRRMIERGGAFVAGAALMLSGTAWANQALPFDLLSGAAHGPSFDHYQGVRGSHAAVSNSPGSGNRTGHKAAGDITHERFDCNMSTTARPGLSGSLAPEVRKFAEYENICRGAINRLMIFTAMPADTAEATDIAADVALKLKEFSRYKIGPVVVMEPVTSKGTISFSDFLSGAYDGALDTFYETLKRQGVTDEMMGIWAPFPEANIPVWGNTDPEQVAACIAKTAQTQKRHFPASQVTVLLDSKSYPSGQSWQGGGYRSLVPYLRGIPGGLIDSFGLQGYPWPDPDPDYDAGHFVNADLAIEAARYLGVKHVWINSGSFSEGKAYNGAKITVTPTLRRQILQDIAAQAEKIRRAGFATAVHVFAEDKSRLSEGINWSYWPTGQAGASPFTEGLADFIGRLRQANIEVWLFDVP